MNAITQVSPQNSNKIVSTMSGKPGSLEKPNSYQDAGIYYLSDTVESSSIKPVIEWILTENVKKEKKELNLIITSPGGYLWDCFALLDIMEGSTIPINTIGLGCIASCGLLIFLYGKNRILTPNTYVMSHEHSSGTYGKYHELFAARKGDDWFNERILKIYQEKTKLSLRKIKQFLITPTDVILTANEALKLGICDEIKLNKF